MAVIYTPHFIQFNDDDGNPLSGGKLYTYAAGTTTPQATYTDAGGLTQNANPVVLDSSGRATVFLSGSYKFRLEDSLGNLIEETDNITAFATGESGVDDIVANFTEDAIAATDSIIFADASDGNTTKRDTVQGIIDLIPSQKRILQRAYKSTTTNDSTALTVPDDNTIPQNGECKVGLTADAFTPTSATSKLRISYSAMISNSSASTTGMLLLFKDSDAGALKTSPALVGSGDPTTISGYYEMTAGTTSAITFKLYFGGISGTTYFLSDNGTVKWGGTVNAHILIEEIEA